MVCFDTYGRNIYSVFDIPRNSATVYEALIKACTVRLRK